MAKIKKYNELDIFLNKAMWSYKNYQDYEKITKDIISELVDEFKISKIDFVLLNISEDKKNLLIDKKKFITFIFDERNVNFKQIKNIFENKNFQHIVSSDNKYYFLKNEVLIKIKFTQIKNLKTVKIKWFNEENKIFVAKAYQLSTFGVFRKKIIIKVKKYKNKVLNVYYIFKLLGLKRVFTFKKGEVYEIKIKSFKKILIESKHSINWVLRGSHLDIVTNNGKNKKIGEIIKYFSNEISFDDLEIEETDMSKIFEEPIHLNKKFWTSGNNFFIYSLIFGFRHDVTPYKDVNTYILENKIIPLYSHEYFSELKKMSPDEISNFLIVNPIEITNNYITSGRHRGMALIGEILNNKSDIKIFITLKFN